jgi:predicted transcriptional regulator
MSQLKRGFRMKKLPRRDRLKIYGDLLSILNEPTTEKIVLTRVQLRINVPFDRLKNYISELKELGLIQDETSLKLTDKGKQYLKEYKTVLDFMNRMGLTYQ